MDSGNVDREEGSEDQEDSQETEVVDFRNVPFWEQDLQEMDNSLHKDRINFSSILLLFLRRIKADLNVLDFLRSDLDQEENDRNDRSRDCLSFCALQHVADEGVATCFSNL